MKNRPKIGQWAKQEQKKRNSHSCTAVGWKFSQDQWVVAWWQGQQRSIQAKTASRDREVVAGFCHSTTCEIFTQLRLIITFDLEQNLIITFCQEKRCVSHFRSHFPSDPKKIKQELIFWYNMALREMFLLRLHPIIIILILSLIF